MGASLPLVSRLLAARDPNFARVLGRLYGWNTLGGVAGALVGEAFLIERLGLRGTAFAAAGANLVAIGLVAGLSDTRVPPPAPRGAATSSPSPLRLLSAAFLCGAILLALEVLWFRLLLLFVYGTSLAFAVMLAVVLLGVALGGLLGARLAPSPASARSLAPAAALLGGAAAAFTYAALPEFLAAASVAPLASLREVARPALALMFPTCVLSGLLFTLFGAALKSADDDAARTSGRLTLANTLGAMLGAPLAGFVILPLVGVENGIRGLAAAYAVVALLCVERPVRPMTLGSLALFTGAVALFPAGLMENHYLPATLDRWRSDGSELLERREGLSESIAYLGRSAFGEPVAVRLVTNGFSMSSSEVSGQRYMKLFAYWPVAVRPAPRRALLISYGVGMTARALAETRSLERIDVVDISREILEMGGRAFPAGDSPLQDPRVRVHVEDGRFFLQASPGETWDLVTGEPPPPKNAGVVSLYTREYFALVHGRLAPGGAATYWLPVYQMSWDESRSIARAFCDAFPDCSLWSGYGLEWMLAGTKRGSGSPDEAAFTRQWRDPTLAPTLAALGFETPEALAATFLAGPERLSEVLAGALPLTDDFPLRLSARPPEAIDSRYLELLDAAAAARAAASSAVLRGLVPAALLERSGPAFLEQARLNSAMGWRQSGREGDLAGTALLLRTAASRFTRLVALRTGENEIAAARRAWTRGERTPSLDLVLGLDALADGRFGAAIERLDQAAAAPPLAPRARAMGNLANDLARATQH
jgi:predicted membrane-bound spermidine synthase